MTKKLAKWLHDKGYVDDDQLDPALDRGTDAQLRVLVIQMPATEVVDDPRELLEHRSHGHRHPMVLTPDHRPPRVEGGTDGLTVIHRVILPASG